MPHVRDKLGLPARSRHGRGLPEPGAVISGALVFTSLAEVSDIADMAATLATRGAHEALTRQVRDILLQFSPDVLTLSTESCAICTKCAYPGRPLPPPG